jgi:hypothetical protein
LDLLHPVHYSYHRALEGLGGDMFNGNALLCKRVDGDWVYTVSVEDQDGSIKLLENIPSNYVSLRKIA